MTVKLVAGLIRFMLVPQNNPSQTILILMSLSLVTGVLGGCITQGISPNDSAAANEGSSNYGTIEFEGEFGPGAVAFLVELDELNRSSGQDAIRHYYDYNGQGSDPEHTSAMLIPVGYIEKNEAIDLRPGDKDNDLRPQLDHVYDVSVLWSGHHTASMQTSEEGLYLNPNNNSGDSYWMFGTRRTDWFPQGPESYWLVFSSSAAHRVEFTLTDARFLQEDPIELKGQEMRLLTKDEEFQSELWFSTHPSPMTGVTLTTGATTTINMDGPVYVHAKIAVIGDHDNLEYSLSNPLGYQVEMRQKLYGASGVFVGGSVIGHEVISTEADIISPLDGAWTVEIGAFEGIYMDFRLFVLSLQELVEYQQEYLG